MSHRVLPRLSLVLVPSLIAGIAAVAVLVPVVEARQPNATATAEAESATLTVPPLPKGTPEQLLAFVEGLLPPKTQPKSREEMIAYISDVSRVSVQAADAILPQVKVDDPLYEKAAKLKLASLMRLGQLGDEAAVQPRACSGDGGQAAPDRFRSPADVRRGKV